MIRILRTDNNVYVDKTEHIYRLLTQGSHYFLSRPRRFGKSLLLSTLKAIFKGEKDLFEGLWIEKKWDWSQTSPIIHLSFGIGAYRQIGLPNYMNSLIDIQAAEHGIVLSREGFALRFQELLEKLTAQKGRVVVLIDEYDKPIIDYLENEKLAQAKENQLVMKSFYSILKDATTYLKFVFITGVSKFSKVSIFSDLNHLDDLTLHPDYAILTGYTQEELEFYFDDYLDR